jgi:hypothetical protein
VSRITAHGEAKILFPAFTAGFRDAANQALPVLEAKTAAVLR